MKKKHNLKVMALGGLEEIGKNLTVFEYGNSILVLDCGLAFPDDNMPGIDLVIPDISYLVKNKEKIVGIVLTHGHEDHIGALPYVLREINVPVYGTALTLGLVENKLNEFGIPHKNKLKIVKPGKIIKLCSEFSVEFIHSNHSIPDACCIAISTPVGMVFHTGDFKIDLTPIAGDAINLTRIGELGKKGIMLLMSESTNVERPGYTMSESTVSSAFEEIFSTNRRHRIVVATFSSNVHRVQQIINCAKMYKRKVAISGRSMENVINTAIKLGYMQVPENLIVDIDEIKKYPADKQVIITTGSQGETMSALTRMAFSEHKKITLGATDTVIISANPIPGNEKSISKVINELVKIGCNVVYDALADIHVSGHACAEELKTMLSITKPKFFIPVHGEYRHLKQHSDLAEKMGVKKKNIFIMGLGQVFETDGKKGRINGSVPSGQVLIDGLGVGDVGNIVLRDRRHLSEDGIVIAVLTLSSHSREILAGPDIVSRGFVYMRENEEFIDHIKERVTKTVNLCNSKNITDWNAIKTKIKNDLNDVIYEKTKRKPLVLPIIMEI